MGFLKRVQAATEVIKLEDIYSQDAQFKQFVVSSVNIIIKFAHRFNLTIDRVLDIFVTQIRKEL